MAASRPGSYLGEVKGQRRNGYGVYIYPNSFFQYEGEWKEGKKHGHGKLLFKDRSYYEGEFAHGEIMGNGFRYWASTGNTYSGQFAFGELHGHGVLQCKDGAKYEGEFSYGMREGHGLLTDKDGQTYEGCFHKNKRHGGGKMIFRNGDEYEGDWILDQRQGHGVLHCADGTVYEGQWRNDTFNGQGSIIHCSGVTYDGLWLNGYPIGQAKKIVILGPEVIDTVPGAAHTLHIQLQDAEGEVSESESGRLLEISAGVRSGLFPAQGKSSSLSGLTERNERQPVKGSCGFEYISYPLMVVASGSQERQAALPTVCKSGFTLPEPPTPEGDLEPGARSEPWDGAGDALSNQDVTDSERRPFAGLQRTECGCAVFRDVGLAPLPENPQPVVPLGEPLKKGERNAGDKTPTEKMTTLQEMVGDGRSIMAAEPKARASQNPLKATGAPPGEYVIMVHEVTSPPFLGQHLPPAFKLLTVLPSKSTRFRKEAQKDNGN